MEQIDPNVMKPWFHYEEIAMHFNQLIIQYRLQLMGGAGIFGVVSGYLVGEKVSDVYLKYKLRAFISTELLFIILAAAFLDLFYYNELLRGAVEALISLEKKITYIDMSTTIKARFCKPETVCDYSGATERIYITYSFIVIPIFFFSVWSWIKLNNYKNG